MTSSKLYNSAGWIDLKEPFDYIYEKYCAGNHGYKNRRIYAYGCSLGGGILSLYLIKETAKPKLSGAIILCQSFDIKKNETFFRKSGLGFYNTAMGFNYYMTLLGMIKSLKLYMSPEKYEGIVTSAKKNKFNLMGMSSALFPKMYGFASEEDYYAYLNIIGSLNNI